MFTKWEFCVRFLKVVINNVNSIVYTVIPPTNQNINFYNYNSNDTQKYRQMDVAEKVISLHATISKD